MASEKEEAEQHADPRAAPISGVMDLRPKRAPIDWEEAKRLYVEEEMSFVEIARIVGYTSPYISAGLAARGVHARPTNDLPDPLSIRLYRVWFDVRAELAAFHATEMPNEQTVAVPSEFWRSFKEFRAWAVEHGYERSKRAIRPDTARPPGPSNLVFLEKAVVAKLRVRKHTPARARRYDAFGESKTAEEWATDSRCQVSGRVLQNRLNDGVLPEVAIAARAWHRFTDDEFGTSEPPRHRRIDSNEARRLYEVERLDPPAIAERLGCSLAGLHEVFKRVGVAMRARPEITTDPFGRRMNHVWASMRKKCRAKRINADSAPVHAEGAITVPTICDEWSRFESFLEWARGANWAPGLCLTRIDRELPYSPSNCRFAPKSEVSRNKRKPKVPAKPRVLITAFGETKGMLAWATDPRCPVTLTALAVRIRGGWHPEDAIVTPPRQVGRSGMATRILTAFGETKSLADWSLDPRCRVTPASVLYRIKRGASVEDALSTPSFEWKDDLESHEP